MRLWVLAIFKNEASGLREWLEHYAWQGATRVCLIDNGSTDAWRPIVEASRALFPEGLDVLERPEPHVQVLAYNEALAMLKTAAAGATADGATADDTWLAVVDLDEFLYSVAERSTVKDYLAMMPETIGQIWIPWRIFGSSGLTKQPESVRKAFTWRAEAPSPTGKGIVRLGATRSLAVHFHDVSPGKTLHEMHDIALNHYMIQSREWFARIKMSRGSAFCAKHDTVRNWSYFDAMDYKQVQDTALADAVAAADTATPEAP